MKYNDNIIHSLTINSGLLFLLFIPFSYAIAQEHFNPALLEMTSATPVVDLSHFELGEQAQGKYRVDIFINGHLVDTQEINFISSNNKNEHNLIPCISLEQLKIWGVKTKNYPAISLQQPQCIDIRTIPQATSEFKFDIQRLNLNIPQIALVTHARDYIPPEQWDEGISAFLLNYNLNGTTSMPRSSGQQTDNSQFVNLLPGLNIGAWRIRNYTTWNHDSNGQNKWDSVNNYASRDIKSLKAQLTAGDSNTSADVFDSLAFRGAQLASDDDMTPDSLKGYAPIIRGIARTNAEVTVYQNGHSIYKMPVSPGAFEINDMYPTGGAGDMQVTIKESDGSEQHLIVPYASLPVLQRERRFKYSLTGGRTNSNDSKKTNFVQITTIYGIPYGMTLYGGLQSAGNDYSAVSMGIGVNMGDIGALSTDITQAQATIRDTSEKNSNNTEKENGQSLRLRYSKDILLTGTNLTVAGYRYSTSGYYSLQDALNTYNSNDNDPGNTGRHKNRTELSLSQDIIYGSISCSLVNESYWDKSRMTSVSVGYNNSIQGISYGLNYTYSLNAATTNSDEDKNNDSDYNNNNDQQISFNISLPLDKFLPSSSLTYNMTSSKNGPTTYNVGANGTALEARNLNWSVQEGYSDDNNKTNGNLSANYKGRYANINGGYAYDQNADRLNYGVQGGVLAHSGGITLSQPFNDTVVLINTEGAEGVPVSNQAGIKTDAKGFAVVPYANPYHKNNITLDTENLQNNNLELEETSKYVIPTRGAVVVAKYSANIGYRVLFTLLLSNGKPVPFGATARINISKDDIRRDNSSIVGDDGQLYFTGLDNKGTLLIAWGSNNTMQCSANYNLPKVKSPSGIEIIHATCR